MSDYPEVERRQGPRVPIQVKCWLERESITLLGVATDLGRGGIRLRSPVSLTTGAVVDLELGFDEGKVRVRGRVAWSAGPAHDGPRGVGVAFEELLCGAEVLRSYLPQPA